MNQMENQEKALAQKIIFDTNANVFLTGKAGTGKTTFLRQLQDSSPKRMVVLAPTGIAAINAGGVTIHSFLQLPFAPFLPGVQYSRENFRMTKNKRRLIRSLDLIVIDEISMVRADLLDAMDDVLRRCRNTQLPFGGVQLLMIGDLQQLPPVAKDAEWAVLSEHYDTPYFFSSRVLKIANFVTIELQTVYRQKDPYFVKLLNAVRTNTAGQEVLDALNARYIPNFVPPKGEHYVQLMTHNHQADHLNQRELESLSTEKHEFVARVSGEFPEAAYPTAFHLVLKIGAQVMFIKNDSSSNHSYYNGMLGEVVSIANREIVVRAHEEKKLIMVGIEQWTNARYQLNEKTKELEEVIDGVFEQYPLRLAWAITIHKSQGLTFEKAVINVSGSFAHGQTYVALSRCKTLEGMVFSAPIPHRAIIQDHAVVQFSANIPHQLPTPETLDAMERAYFLQLLSEVFDFADIDLALHGLVRILNEFFYKTSRAVVDDFNALLPNFQEQVGSVGQRFMGQLQQLVATETDYRNCEKLQGRIAKATTYFLEKLEPLSTCLSRVNLSTGNKMVAKRADMVFDNLKLLVEVRMSLLRFVEKDGFEQRKFQNERTLRWLEVEESSSSRATHTEKRARSGTKVEKTMKPVEKPKKEPTREQTMRLYREGKTAEEIAEQRGLTVGTILKHLSAFVKLGEIPLTDLVAPNHIALITAYLEEHPDTTSFTDIRSALDEEVEFEEIRLVLDARRTE